MNLNRRTQPNISAAVLCKSKNMSRVIIFSRVFPAYHPKVGQPTYFVEQIYNSIYRDKSGDWSDALGTTSNYVVDVDTTILGRKHHTIRNGNRWKVGDKFSPRVWSGKPYNSKQIILCPDVEIVATYNFDIDEYGVISSSIIGGRGYYDIIGEVAKNDGLELCDFEAWFKLNKPKPLKPFEGQIICWQDCGYNHYR